MQMNVWKIIYLNCGEEYEFMIDHRSYLFIDLLQFMAYKKQRPKDELQKSQRPHIKADHLRY